MSEIAKWLNEVDVFPERYGWVPLSSVICSECKISNISKTNYCPNCGCKISNYKQVKVRRKRVN